MTHCTRKVKGRKGPRECGHPAVTVYSVEGEQWPLCRKHDSEAAHRCAEERGYGVRAA